MTKLQPIDRISLGLMLVFGLTIAILVGGGTVCGTNCFFRTGPHVQDFSWQDRQIGVEDKAFILAFDRPMDRTSVEKNLVIDPSLPGKLSWAGRRLAYTLEEPIPYGETYEVQLEGAREQFRKEDRTGQSIEPFAAKFRSRDRALAYIGIQEQERGRLVLHNLTQKQTTILTPPNLTVIDFKFYPKGDRILFSAAENNRGIEGLRELQLYRVATNINTTAASQSSNTARSTIELVLDNQTYQNNQFDLSPDGETIVVQRVDRQNPADFDLWMIKEGSKPERLNTPGGDFLITPDSQTLAVAQGEGIGIIPLESDAEPLDFLPKFGQLLSFSQDGSAAAMVNFNTDNANLRYTRSLFYVNNQGIQKELLKTQGNIVDCRFHPSGDSLYCLLTELLPGQDYQEQPYFVKIDLDREKVFPLVALPNYRDIKLSMAPDGLGILFDRVITSDRPSTLNPLTTDSGETIVDSHLWLLIPPTNESPTPEKPQLQELSLVGFYPQWSP